MSENCVHCGAEIDAQHPVHIGRKIENFSYGWDYWEYEIVEGDQTSIDGLGVVTMVAKHVKWSEDQGEDNRPIFMIFEVNGQYYRKSGTADSDGDNSWTTGGFLPAVKKTKTIEEWA